MEDCSKTISQSLSLCHRPAHPPSPDLFPIRFIFCNTFSGLFIFLQYFLPACHPFAILIPSCGLFPSCYLFPLMKSLTLSFCHYQTHPPSPDPLPFLIHFPSLPIVLGVKSTFQFLTFIFCTLIQLIKLSTQT